MVRTSEGLVRGADPVGRNKLDTGPMESGRCRRGDAAMAKHSRHWVVVELWLTLVMPMAVVLIRPGARAKARATQREQVVCLGHQGRVDVDSYDITRFEVKGLKS